jgi:hypothetical protein
MGRTRRRRCAIGQRQSRLVVQQVVASTLAGVYPREVRCFTVGPGVAYDAYAWPTSAPFLYSCCLCAASGSCATPLAVRWLPEQPIGPSEQVRQPVRGR